MKTPEWITRAERLLDSRFDVGVNVWDTLYVGPENGMSPEQWRDLRAPLYRPKIVAAVSDSAVQLATGRVPEIRFATLGNATSEDLEELGRYFTDVLRVMKEHRRTFSPSDPLFSLRLSLLAGEDHAISWNWHSKWNEIEPVMQAISATVQLRSLIYDDIEQGWQVIVFATPETLYLRRSDFDTGEEMKVVACNRERSLQQLMHIKATVPPALAGLESSLGVPGLFSGPTIL